MVLEIHINLCVTEPDLFGKNIAKKSIAKETEEEAKKVN